MAVKKLDHIKNIKYSGVHPLDKKKLIKKINNYIDSYNDSRESFLNSLEFKEFRNSLSDLASKKVTKKTEEKIHEATLKNSKNTLKEIDTSVRKIILDTSADLSSLKKLTEKITDYIIKFYSNVDKKLDCLKVNIYKEDLKKLAYLVISKSYEEKLNNYISECSEKNWEDIFNGIENLFKELNNSLNNLESTIGLINQKHLSENKISTKINDYIREKIDNTLDKNTGREHLGGNVRSLYDEYINEIKTELKKIFKKISDDEIKSVRDLINLGLKNSDPSKSFKIVNSAIESAYKTLNENINSGKYGIKEFITKTVKPKIDEIINKAKQQNQKIIHPKSNERKKKK